MKRRLLRQIFCILTFLASQIGFASGHPRNSGNNTFNTANPNSCTQEDKCFVFNYKGYKISTDGKKVTLTFSIKTNCAHDLSYAAFEIPAGSTATVDGTSKFRYKTEITNNPFRSIKFEGSGISGYKNGAEDVFKYILSKADFDKLTTIRVQAKAATTVGTVTFVKNCSDVPPCLVSNVVLTNIKYTVDGITSTNLQAVAKSGKPVKVCFTVPASEGSKTYSFVSYKAPTPYFDRNLAEQQELFDYKTITVDSKGGTFCLEIKVPDCYFQVDFVRGCIIEKLGPPNSNNYYGDQGRLISSAVGGIFACTINCEAKTGTLTNIKYYINNQIFTTLLNNVKQGMPVRVCFDVPAGIGSRTFSLVSYSAPNPVYSEQEAELQKVFDFKTVTLGTTTSVTNVCLQVNVPNCYFQVDFVKGCIIEKLGPAGTTNFYGRQGRLISADNGGTVSCTPPENLGSEGCTPGYWKNNKLYANWAVPTTTKFFDVFTVCDMEGKNCFYQGLSPNLTLLEALNLGGGQFQALARHAAAAYLNAKNLSVKYSIPSATIISDVVNAFKTGKWEAAKNKLEAANEKGCPIDNSLKMTSSISVNVADVAVQETTALSVFPNPFNNKATIRFALKNTEEYSVSLYNMNGKQVRMLKTGAANAGELVQLNVDGLGLSEGLYLVRLVTKTETQTVKLVLKK